VEACQEDRQVTTTLEPALMEWTRYLGETAPRSQNDFSAR
jgi:hypothetical protein